MTYSIRFNELRPTSQFSARTEIPMRFVLHGAAMTSLDALSDMIVSGSRQVSAHGGFKDARGIGWIDEENRAWSLSDETQDSLAWVTENANESIDGYTFTAATQESIAQWIADVAKRKNVWPHRDGNPTTWTVIGHSEVWTIYHASYPTACPTVLDLAWITARAQQILTGSESDDDVTLFQVIQQASKDGLVNLGWLYKQIGNGPVTPCTNLEAVFVSGAKEINGQDLRVLSYEYGLAEHLPIKPGTVWGANKNLEGPGQLTGKVFYASTTAVFPPIGGGGGSTDLTPVLAKLDETLTAISNLDKQGDQYQVKLEGLLGEIKTSVAAVPAATVKAQGAALANG